MNLNESRVVGIAQRYLDDSLRGLASDGKPMPFIVGDGPHGARHVELHCLTDSDFPETARTVIPAFIVLDEAFEIAMAAFTTDPTVCDGQPECAFIANWGPKGRALSTSVVTRRKGQPPVIAGWAKGPPAASLGPLDDGVSYGFAMAYRIWSTEADELRERIDSIRSAAETADSNVLPLTVDALRDWGWLD